jgi:hypothetical protein
MLKHLDYLMINNGGGDPFHYLKGKGGLGYKPSPPFMHGLGYDYNLMDGMGIKGGMSMENPQFRKERDTNYDYNKEEYDKDEDLDEPPILLGDNIKYDEDGNVINTNVERLSKIENMINKGEYDDAYERIIFELTDLFDIQNYIKKHVNNPIDNERYKYSQQLENKLQKLAEKIPDFEEEGLLDDIQKMKQESENKYALVKNETEKFIEHQTANLTPKEKNQKIAEEAGNVNEEYVEKRRRFLSSIDGDKSTPHNSKSLLAYDVKFRKILDKIYNELSEDEKDEYKDEKGRSKYVFLRNKFLKYFPIDFIKNKTLWELKSHSDNKEKYQPYSTNKIEGYYGIGNPIYNIVYTTKNGERRVENITFTYKLPDGTFKTINTLPHRKTGYNYLTSFNTEFGNTYYNALGDEDFEKTKIPLREEYKNKQYIEVLKDDFKNGFLDDKIITHNKDNNVMSKKISVREYFDNNNLTKKEKMKTLINNFDKRYRVQYSSNNAYHLNKEEKEPYKGRLNKEITYEGQSRKPNYKIDKGLMKIIPLRLQNKYLSDLTLKQKEKIKKQYK